MVRRTEADNGLMERLGKRVPLGRIAQADEIADVVMFLSSPRSSFVVGVGWLVDGGASAPRAETGTLGSICTMADR